MRSDVDGSWRVASLVRSGFVCEYAVRLLWTGELVARDLAGGWRVLSVPAEVSKDVRGRWRVAGLARSDLTGRWSVVEERLVRSSASGAWRVAALLRRDVRGSWTVERRPNDMYPTCQLNGISLRVIRDFEPGGAVVSYDEIRHYDGSLRVHDVRHGIYERRVDIMLTAATPAALDAEEEQIRAACRAGGTFVWQSRGPGGALGPVKVDTVVPSDVPSFVRNKTREALYRSFATLALRIMPS